jgi:hypothetical protein
LEFGIGDWEFGIWNLELGFEIQTDKASFVEKSLCRYRFSVL